MRLLKQSSMVSSLIVNKFLTVNKLPRLLTIGSDEFLPWNEFLTLNLKNLFPTRISQ